VDGFLTAAFPFIGAGVFWLALTFYRIHRKNERRDGR
jgi:hypothetical protein